MTTGWDADDGPWQLDPVIESRPEVRGPHATAGRGRAAAQTAGAANRKTVVEHGIRSGSDDTAPPPRKGATLLCGADSSIVTQASDDRDLEHLGHGVARAPAGPPRPHHGGHLGTPTGDLVDQIASRRDRANARTDHDDRVISRSAQPLPGPASRPGGIEDDQVDRLPQRRDDRVEPVLRLIRRARDRSPPDARSGEGEHRHASALGQVGGERRPVDAAGEPVEIFPAQPRLVLQARHQVESAPVGVGVDDDRRHTPADGTDCEGNGQGRHTESTACPADDDELTHVHRLDRRAGGGPPGRHLPVDGGTTRDDEGRRLWTTPWTTPASPRQALGKPLTARRHPPSPKDRRPRPTGRSASGHATAPVGGTTGAVFRAGSGGEGPVRALNPIGGATRLIVGPQGAKRKQLAREFLSLRRVRPSEVAVTYDTEALIALS